MSVVVLLVLGVACDTGSSTGVDGPSGPQTRPELQNPAVCVDARSIGDYADDLDLSPSAIEHYWLNRDSAFVLAEWDYENGRLSTPPQRCVTDDEQAWLDTLVDARAEGLLLDETRDYLLGRHRTVGSWAVSSLEKTIESVEEVRATVDPSQTIPSSGILQTVDFELVQPEGQLPGTNRALRSDGSYFVPELETNEKVGSWTFSAWNGEGGESFVNRYVDELRDIEICGPTLGGTQTNTQSTSIRYNQPASEADEDTPVRLGMLFEDMRVENVTRGTLFGIPDWRVFVVGYVPFDDQSVLASDGSIEHLNMLRSPRVMNGHVHLFDPPSEIAGFNGTPIPVETGDLLGDTKHTLYDTSYSITTYDVPLDGIPSDFPRSIGAQIGFSGLLYFDPSVSVFVDDARAGGISDDMIMRFGPKLWGEEGPYGEGIVYQGDCKPIDE